MDLGLHLGGSRVSEDGIIPTFPDDDKNGCKKKIEEAPDWPTCHCLWEKGELYSLHQHFGEIVR